MLHAKQWINSQKRISNSAAPPENWRHDTRKLKGKHTRGRSKQGKQPLFCNYQKGSSFNFTLQWQGCEYWTSWCDESDFWTVIVTRLHNFFRNVLIWSTRTWFLDLCLRCVRFFWALSYTSSICYNTELIGQQLPLRVPGACIMVWISFAGASSLV